MTTKLEQLKAELSDIYYLGGAAALLGWDQHTYMPPGGALGRSKQSAVLAKVIHQRATGIGDLLAAAEDECADLNADTDDAAMLRMARRDYDRATKIPAELMAEISLVTGQAQTVWVEARKKSDYAIFAPWLEKILALSLQVTDCLGFEDERYDALLDHFEPGMKTAQVRTIFKDLKAELVPLFQAVQANIDKVDDSALHGDFPVETQRLFGEEVIRDFGFSFETGRQDETVHPFTQSLTPKDVRITTRFDPTWLAPALFGTLHEAGHGMYEQGLPAELEGNVLCRGVSLGVHESQSRLWENIVGRSRGFWQRYYPRLQELFPTFAEVDLDTFYRAINKVSPSFIRVEADELTYNLHIMLRFEMELMLINGELSVADAPGVWDEKMQKLLGITPPNAAQGILQDVHWSAGLIGYFSTYSLGNLLSVQLYNKAVADFPEIPADIKAGQFDKLLGWMREHIHQPGRRYLPPELIERATGEPMQARSYVAYLRNKYGDIYEL